MKTDKTNQEHQQGQTEIFEYIRRSKGNKVHKIGVIYGTTIGDTIKIGWSKCNVKEGDEFNPDSGIRIAMNRALTPSAYEITAVPLCIKRQVRQFGARCIRYFQEANKLELPI